MRIMLSNSSKSGQSSSHLSRLLLLIAFGANIGAFANTDWWKTLSELDDLINETEEASEAGQMDPSGRYTNEAFWEDLNIKLFPSPENKPEETRISLEQLRHLWKIETVDPSQPTRLENINKLIDLSVIEESRCEPRVFMRFNSFIKQNAQSQKTILSYLKFYREQLLLKCQSILVEAIERLGASARKELSTLTGKILSEHIIRGPATLAVGEEAAVEPQPSPEELSRLLLESILRTAEMDGKDKLHYDSGLQKFYKYFEHHVELLCGPFGPAMSKLMKIYNLYFLEKDIVARFDERALDGIKYARVCRYIKDVKNQESVIDKIYSDLIAKDIDILGLTELEVDPSLDSLADIEKKLAGPSEIAPGKTLMMLSKLEQIIRLKDSEKFGIECRDKREKIGELIEMHAVGMEHCTRAHFTKLTKAIEFGKKDENIKIYLDDIRFKLLNICERALDKMVRPNPIINEDLRVLVESINGPTKPAAALIDLKDVLNGLAHYMEYRAKGSFGRYISNNYRKDLDHFLEDFKTSGIVNKCSEFVAKMKPWVLMYSAYTAEPFLLENLSSPTRVHFDCARVCREVLSGTESEKDLRAIIPKVHAIVVERNGNLYYRALARMRKSIINQQDQTVQDKFRQR